MADTDSTSKSPAFQFYPKDFLADEKVRVMTLQERGAYVTLLCLCWLEGTLPVDMGRLARLCGVPTATFQRLWPALEACFRVHSERPDRLIQPRLERERRRQATFASEQSERGKRGAAKRWQKDSAAINLPSSEDGGAMISPMADYSSPSSSPSSSPDSSQKRERAREPLNDGSTTVKMRAGHFCEVVYPELYRKFRKGACYVGKPALDYQEAQLLCQTWDDERLVKIATVFLTTDHDFAENGSRTMAQFRAMASWCDGKLREAGL